MSNKINVLQPQKNNNLQAVGSLAGLAIGGLPGMAIGSSLGGAAESLRGPQAQPQPIGGGSSDAITRRLDAQNGGNLDILKAAEKYMVQMPESLRKEYAPTIYQAKLLEQKRQGMV